MTRIRMHSFNGLRILIIKTSNLLLGKWKDRWKDLGNLIFFYSVAETRRKENKTHDLHYN